MSRIALLTCGESVFSSWNPLYRLTGRYEAVVGVNWIGCHDEFVLDWLCVKDRCVWEDVRLVVPGNGFVTSGGLERRWDAVEYRNFLGDWSDEVGWSGKRSCQFTFPDALRWALWTFPDRRVDVFGLDMDGGRGACRDDWRHDEGRWKKETVWLRHLVRTYGERMVLVGCKFKFEELI